MTRTLKDLFNNQPFAQTGGQTASEAYDVRDSKKIEWSSSNPLIQNTGIQVANQARKRRGNRTEETLVEQETTGIRVVRAGSAPVLYGTELGRLTLGTTKTKDRMIQATSGELSDTGILGDSINRVRDTIDNTKSTLGFLNRATPTYVVNKLKSGDFKISQDALLEGGKYNGDEIQDRMIDLGSIKADAEGTFWGNAFNNSLSFGTPKDIGRQIVGGTLSAGKKFVSNALFGSQNEVPNGLQVTGDIVVQDPYIAYQSVSGFTEDSRNWNGTININYGSIDNPTGLKIQTTPAVSLLDKDGLRYSKTIQITGSSDERPEGQTGDISTKQVLAGFPSDLNEIRYSKPENDIIRPKKGTFANNINLRDVPKDERLPSKGIQNHFDATNISEVYDDDVDALENADFITLKFKSVATGKLAYFRATITGLNESFQPEWGTAKFTGNPFSLYTYNGIQRDVSFSFTVFSLSAREHKRSWQRLNFLSSLVYPQGYYENSTAIKAPFIEFTLGDMYKNRIGFFEELSFEVDDNYPWNINNDESYVSNVLSSNRRVVEEQDLTNYKLPTLINVNVGIKILESRENTQDKKFYNFSPDNIT